MTVMQITARGQRMSRDVSATEWAVHCDSPIMNDENDDINQNLDFKMLTMACIIIYRICCFLTYFNLIAFNVWNPLRHQNSKLQISYPKLPVSLT